MTQPVLEKAPPPPATALLEIDDVSVEFGGGRKWKAVTHGISFSVAPGETVALVGESGSGKSVTAMAVLDLLPENARRTGSIRLDGEELVGASEKRLRQVRGRDVAVIFQEPMTALNPVYTIGHHLAEAIRSHRDVSKAEAAEKAVALLRQVHMPHPEEKVKHYPHQLSGGQRQRAMIAMAMASEPRLLIADEPTTALDVTVQAEILDLVRELQQRTGMGVLIITHDMGVVADVSDRVVVMRDGRVVETAPSRELFGRPQHDYTKALLEAVPRLGSGTTSSAVADRSAPPVLELEGVAIEYPGSWRKAGFRAGHDLDISVAPGEIVGLVGESGSGKSTIGRLAMGLLPVAAGRMEVGGRDVSAGSRADLVHIRSQVSMVFQDPASSLDPRRTIGRSITDPLRWTGKLTSTKACRARAQELLDDVRLPKEWVDRYPHELSGGQRQRVGIARAMATNPRLLVADEPTSALDVSVQAAVLDLFSDLQREHGFSCLFITHDLSVVEQLATSVVVLQHGRVVEQGPTARVLDSPQEDYTRRLIAAAPVPDPDLQAQRRAQRLAG
ncbi:ABC transporter ATP-binding protein [Nocardioides zeae]|uniref:Peptide/nickel transport system ATP-binding protein n=1 Tax=Nocardioides zeae TaxID=1457234 RepID=A0AAJ1U8C6_9ACTN|nr:ABC transporter ATP-binding protein [Nocardioides zeae]MDQ1106022.1 peptide/nickel transport system ATP-binding protein [Nocardioides zeae]